MSQSEAPAPRVDRRKYSSQIYKAHQLPPARQAVLIDLDDLIVLLDSQDALAAAEARAVGAESKLETMMEMQKFSTPADPTGTRNGLLFQAIKAERDAALRERDEAAERCVDYETTARIIDERDEARRMLAEADAALLALWDQDGPLHTRTIRETAETARARQAEREAGKP